MRFADGARRHTDTQGWPQFGSAVRAAPNAAQQPDRALTHACAVKTVCIDDASTLAFAANAYARAARDYDTALYMIQHALVHNWSDAHALAVGSVVSAWAGRWENAVDLAERSLHCSADVCF